jgi:hypothetical protein
LGVIIDDDTLPVARLRNANISFVSRRGEADIDANFSKNVYYVVTTLEGKIGEQMVYRPKYRFRVRTLFRTAGAINFKPGEQRFREGIRTHRFTRE